jgi:ABC-type lipoprotein release transport system permease subunit
VLLSANLRRNPEDVRQALTGNICVADNSVIVLFAIGSEDVSLWFGARELLITSTTMLTVGLLGCIEPARRALRINPADALKEAQADDQQCLFRVRRDWFARQIRPV